ncbi:hypothetical protein [Nocardia thraciensis]
MTLENVWLGWWGPFSMFINAATMLFNVLPYRDIARLAPPVPGMPGKPLDPGKPLFRRPGALGFLIPAALAGVATAIAVTGAGSSDTTSAAMTSSTSAETMAIDLSGLCRALSTHMPESDLLGPMNPLQNDMRSAQSCTWRSDSRYATVEVQAIDDAEAHYQTATERMSDPKWGGSPLEDIPALGDRAAAASTTHYTDTGATVAVQLRNMTAQVTWTGRGVTYPDAKERAIAVARKAIELAAQ